MDSAMPSADEQARPAATSAASPIVILTHMATFSNRCSNAWQLPCLQNLHISTSSSGPWLADDAATDSSTAAAAAAAAAAEAAAACTPQLGIFSAGAAALDALHAASGLPWWAVIPATSVAIKTLLLPVSLRQAKIVRTNMVLWAESFEFLRQRDAREKHKAEAAAAAAGGSTVSQHSTLLATAQPDQQQQAASATDGAQQAQALLQQVQAANSATAALQQLQHWQARLAVYHELRVKCGVPHPAWFAFNQLLQVIRARQQQQQQAH
jgi:hypothetical protein